MRIIHGAASFSLLSLSACTSSGVAQTGPDSYAITTTALTSFGGAGSANGKAFEDAQSFCARKGNRALITQNQTAATIPSGSADIGFKCEA